MAKKKTNSRDLQFIYDTQPNGNLNVKNEYVNQQGAVFSACIHIINLPDEFTDFWLTTLTAYDNTMLVVDHFKDRTKDYPKSIKDSIRELTIQYDRTYDQTEKDDIAQDVSILRGLSQDLQKRGISVRDLHLRLFVYGPNLNTLEKRVNEVMHSISNSGFQGTVFLDENDDEYRSIFLPGNDQKLLRSNREALPMPTPILGLGYGHNQTSLADPRGAYYGYTRTGGLVYWDLFDISPGRFYYNFFLSGDMGSGKSTMLKKIIQDRLIRGDLVRVFDKSGEFRSMVEYYGGQIIQLDGSNGMINMFQVYPIITNKDSDEVDIQGSYRAKLASLTVNYKLLAGGDHDYDAKIFTDLCDQYYKANHYFDREQSITDLAPTEYPTISDIITFVQQKAEKETDSELSKSYTRIQVNLKPLKTQYSNLFDGPTTIANDDRNLMHRYNKMKPILSGQALDQLKPKSDTPNTDDGKDAVTITDIKNYVAPQSTSQIDVLSEYTLNSKVGDNEIKSPMILKVVVSGTDNHYSISEFKTNSAFASNLSDRK